MWESWTRHGWEDAASMVKSASPSQVTDAFVRFARQAPRPQLAVDVLRPATRELRLVVRFEGHDVEAVAADGERARVLRGHLQVRRHAARRDIDDGDAVGRGERDVGLLVARERDAGGLVEAGPAGRVDDLDGGQNLVPGGTGRIRRHPNPPDRQRAQRGRRLQSIACHGRSVPARAEPRRRTSPSRPSSTRPSGRTSRRQESKRTVWSVT